MFSAPSTVPEFNADEAAEYLGLSKTTVFRLVRNGELSHTRVTRWIRFSSADLEGYLQRRHRAVAAPSQTARPRRTRVAS